ncbi:MAG: glutamine amidotransferase [Thermogutta sp.]
MLSRVCYFGDDELTGPAAYLAGVMEYCGFEYEHVPSRRRVADELLKEPFALYVISDYPSVGFTLPQLQRIKEHVEQGSGLLMIGGWESYFGRVGEYVNRPIAEVLPVYLSMSDDRVNCAQGCVVRMVKRHPITDGLPWDKPPLVAGFNRIFPKPQGTTLLAGDRLTITDDANGLDVSVADTVPLLVVGRFVAGRTAALAFDVAPHWIGGMVDWGEHRIVVQIPAGGYIEVGDAYVRLLGNIIAWTGKLRELPDAYPEEDLSASASVTVVATDTANGLPSANG